MKKPFNFRLDTELVKKIDKLAKKTFKTRTQVLIDALVKYLSKS